MTKQISLFIFACFVLAQGWKLYAGAKPTALSERFSIPVRVDIDKTLDPPRRVIVALPRTAAHKPLTELYSCEHFKNERMVVYQGASPEICWVFGKKMAWNQVTTEDLRHIPGIGIAMAKRLIRIRDTESISTFMDLLSFPHVGKNPVDKLRQFCFIN
jgi:hypothetical protein